MEKLEMARLLPVIALLALALALPAGAGTYNPALDVGETAPEWAALPSADGQTYDSRAFEDARVLVVAFTCNTCPYAVDHEERLVDLAKAYEGQRVRLVAINSNAGEKDSLAAMTQRAREKKFAFPYLKDEAGAVGKAFGATRTPEFVVLDAERKVVYLGALDDDPDGKMITKRHVEAAIRAALSGERPEVAETPPIGCGVKYPRERRPKGIGRSGEAGDRGSR